MNTRPPRMDLKHFDYDLPPELIAQNPAPVRDTARLLVLERTSGTITHTRFRDLPAFLRPGDLLVANNTRVIPARLYGRKETGGWVEIFLLSHLETPAPDTQVWECLLKTRRKISAPGTIIVNDRLRVEILRQARPGHWHAALHCSGPVQEVLEQAGRAPLPPYIKRSRTDRENPHDRERYQTVYAACNGAVAAPTAGLHFTPALMEAVNRCGAGFAFLTLHVGHGTFQPIRTEQVEDHHMHSEYFSIPPETAARVNAARQAGNRVIAVGTTATRALESRCTPAGMITPGQGHTSLYIYPGYRFSAIDAMITNFHLPRSSLLLLVAAFAGTGPVLEAYRTAVAGHYRFFSYGDAMLIL